MKLDIGEIYTVKLTSGEELITKVLENHDGYLTISDPVSVAPGPQGMGLVPSMFTADPGEPVRLNTNAVTIFCKTEENVKNKYIEATTGIKLPSKKIVMG